MVRNNFSPRTPCGRVSLARFTLEDHAYGASRLPKSSENDCFAVYLNPVVADVEATSDDRETTTLKV